MSELFPVVIQDSSTGAVLMLGYGNALSLRRTEETGFVHFWSRSRQELWRKGATSGNVLRVVEMMWDCDEDALLIHAEPAGPTCHTGEVSCFGAAPSPEVGLRDLERIIADRKRNRPEGSYTVRLLDGGTDLTARKVLEEAGEVAFAAKDQAPDRVAEEAADLLYHLLVLLADQDVTLGDVERVLNERAS